MNNIDIDYYTDEPCERCGGDGYDPDQAGDVSLLLNFGPRACTDCEGRGKAIDSLKFAQYEDELDYRRRHR
jgi:hypothetical protein